MTPATLKNNLTRIVELVFLGPFVVLAVIAVISLVAFLLAVFLPYTVILIFFCFVVAFHFFVDLFIHPHLFKFWVVVCFLAAAFFVYIRNKRSDPELPDPVLRRGRDIEPGQRAKQRAADAITRRRKALRRRSLS